MKLLMFAHQLEYGGTQVNAIELAAALRDLHGFDVTLFATPGPMVGLVQDKGLRFIPAPWPSMHPSLARMQALRDVIRTERPDLIHVWDWWQCLDAYYGAHIPSGIPMVVTDMMMELTHILPKRLTTTFGTPEVLDQAKANGRRHVHLMVPPVDIHLNAPGAVNPVPFREQYGIRDGDIIAVTVSRLAKWMKSESIFRTMETVRTLGREMPLRFFLIGEGALRPQFEKLAAEINIELGRAAVVLTGALLDSRPAYEAADIVIGMGGSALRGMAFGKPVIVVGEQGFSLPFTPETAESFYYKGLYGRGKETSGNADLAAQIRAFANNREYRSSMGQFSRDFVVQHFALETVSSDFAALCRRVVVQVPPTHFTVADGLRTAAVYFKERRFLQRLCQTNEFHNTEVA